MDIGYNRHLQLILDGLQHLQALFEPRAAKAVEGRAVRLIERSLEDVGNPQPLRDFLDRAANIKAAIELLKHTGTC